MWTPLNLLSWETWTLIGTIIALVWYYVHRKWQYLRELNIPHDPPSVFKLGHLAALFDKETGFTYDNTMKKKHGPIWGSYALLSPGITIHDPDILRQIFIKEFHSFPVRMRTLTRLNGKELNDGLTSVEGKQWKRIRSSLTPTFSSAKLKQMTYIMDRCVDNAAAALDRKIKSNNGVFNSKTIFSRLSLDVVCSAAFSTEVNSQDDTVQEPEIAKLAKSLFKGSLFHPLPLICFLFPPFERIAEYFNMSIFPKAPLNYFKALTSHIIRQRETDTGSKKHTVDLMQLMLNGEISEKEAKSGTLEKGMDRNEIVGNAMLMILAGYENTGNTMSFLAYNLAYHPEIQRKLQDEIDEMINKNGKFTYDSVAELKYLDMCINETLRLYNPTLRNGRICDKEITIKGLTIPKGITVNIPSFGLSHDTEYWDEPSLFKPERPGFSVKVSKQNTLAQALRTEMSDMSQIDPIVFQPFGAGPRNCIGLRFALMEIKMGIAKLVHQFNFLPAENTPKPPLKLDFGLSVKPLIDYDLRVVRRTEMA